jgi:hypothetical protein
MHAYRSAEGKPLLVCSRKMKEMENQVGRRTEQLVLIQGNLLRYLNLIPLFRLSGWGGGERTYRAAIWWDMLLCLRSTVPAIPWSTLPAVPLMQSTCILFKSTSAIVSPLHLQWKTFILERYLRYNSVVAQSAQNLITYWTTGVRSLTEARDFFF